MQPRASTFLTAKPAASILLSSSKKTWTICIISLTCYAWQARNQDAYFVVTGHWIEESSPGVCVYNSALLGFMQINTTHDGARLGCAVFKVVQCLGFAHKVY